MKLKLNSEKCVFCIQKGKVLGCLVNPKGIEAIPDKVNAIINIYSPHSKKEVQKRTGRMAPLNRFISRLAKKKSLPFLKLLKSSNNFEWVTDQQKAFKDLKEHLAQKVRMASLEQGEVLLLYVSASHFVVGAALVQEKKVKSIIDKNGKEKELFQ